MSRPALRSTQLSIQWVPGAVSLGVKWMGRVLIFHLQLMLRLRRSGAVPPFILHLFVACTTTTLPSLPFLESLIMREAV
jgi:hypothetical protein